VTEAIAFFVFAALLASLFAGLGNRAGGGS